MSYTFSSELKQVLSNVPSHIDVVQPGRFKAYKGLRPVVYVTYVRKGRQGFIRLGKYLRKYHKLTSVEIQRFVKEYAASWHINSLE